MTKKQFRTCLQVLCVLLVILITMTAYVAGKYIKQIQFNGSVTFTSSLATSMVLQEHKPVRQNDGSYILAAETVTGVQKYILMPGVDIPKDPHIVITGKTPIQAYLYIEIEKTAPVTFAVDTAKWEHLMTVDGKEVYYYKGEIAKNDVIYIFEGGKDATVTVSHTLLHQDGIDSDEAVGVIRIHALMKEKFGADPTPTNVYVRPN